MAPASTLPALDVAALVTALDDERGRRGMTWAAVAREVHCSVASIQGMGTRGSVEADAVVFMLQWLRRHCADFVIGPRRGLADAARPPVPERYARFDTIALHAALDRARQQRGLGWKDVAAALGASPGVIARLSRGGRTSANLMVAAADWAGEHVEALLQPSQPVPGHARMDAGARAPRPA